MRDVDRPDTVVCTMTDSSFERGCSVLLNSLIKAGYRGKVLIGLIGEGHTLPEILKDNPDLPESLDVQFLKLETGVNPNFHKPHVIKSAFSNNQVEKVFFFDADIVCNYEWPIFDNWVDSGVALCSDINFLWMPATHPRRAAWNRLLSQQKRQVRPVVGYANGGFVGLKRAHLALVDLWQDLLDWAESTKGTAENFSLDEYGFNKYDQDFLNAALQGTNVDYSFVGHEGMSFGNSVGFMLHAIGRRKPWDRGFLWTLLKLGRGPSLIDIAFWKNVDGPIRMFSDREVSSANVQLYLSRILQRFIA